MSREVKTVNITPTWRAIIPMLVLLIENGTPEGKKSAIDELYRLADFADKKNIGKANLTVDI